MLWTFKEISVKCLFGHLRKSRSNLRRESSLTTHNKKYSLYKNSLEKSLNEQTITAHSGQQQSLGWRCGGESDSQSHHIIIFKMSSFSTKNYDVCKVWRGPSISYKWHQTICSLFCLAAFTKHSIFEFEPPLGAHIITLFPFMDEHYSTVWIEHIFFIHSSVDEYLGCFHSGLSRVILSIARHLINA